MAQYDSHETTWADQWDYNNPDPISTTDSNKKSNSKYGKKVGEGLEKTKTVATAGMKKVKEGTVSGFHWIKDKCNKKTQKN